MAEFTNTPSLILHGGIHATLGVAMKPAALLTSCKEKGMTLIACRILFHIIMWGTAYGTSYSVDSSKDAAHTFSKRAACSSSDDCVVLLYGGCTQPLL